MQLLIEFICIDSRFGRPAKTTLKPRSGKEYQQIGYFLDGDLKVNVLEYHISMKFS